MRLADRLLGTSHTVEFTTHLRPEQCCEHLAASLRTDLRFSGPPRPLFGRVSSEGFSVRFWRNNRMPGDVRARGRFTALADGTRIEVTLAPKRVELLALPVVLIASVFVTYAVFQQPLLAALMMIPIVLVYLRSRMIEPRDRAELTALIRDALQTQ